MKPQKNVFYIHEGHRVVHLLKVLLPPGLRSTNNCSSEDIEDEVEQVYVLEASNESYSTSQVLVLHNQIRDMRNENWCVVS